MRLTASSRDTVLAILDLAVHSGADCKVVKLQDIAERQSIALSWLEQLFAKLRKQDIVKNVRGPGGGYVLAKNTEQINVASLMSCASGAIDMRQCQGKGNCRTGQHTSHQCLAHNLWDYISDQLNTTLSGISIEDIINKLNLNTLRE